MGWRKTGGRPRELISEIRKLAVAFNPPPSYQTHTHTHTHTRTQHYPRLACTHSVLRAASTSLLGYVDICYNTIRYDMLCERALESQYESA